MAWILPAISAVTALAGLFAGQKKVKQPTVPTIDLSAELAKLDALYAEQKAGTTARMERQLAQTQARTSESLAGRGIYSSPVSEASFGANRDASTNALADALAQISGQQADTRAKLTSTMAKQQAEQLYAAAIAQYQSKLENRNRLSSALMGAGSAGLEDTDWGKLFPKGGGMLTGKLSLDPISRF